MRSEQTRQLRRERKRLNREERRRKFRGHAGAEARPRVDVHAALDVMVRELPPMGETLMEYADAFVSVMFGPDLEPDQLRAVLLLAAVFWNIAIEEDDYDKAVSLTSPIIAEKLRMPIEQAVHDAETLITVKLEHFPYDPRTIEDVAVSRDGDRIRVTARSTVLHKNMRKLARRFEQ